MRDHSVDTAAESKMRRAEAVMPLAGMVDA